MVDGRARTLTSLLMNAPTMRSPRDRTNVTEFVKISTLVLVQQQQLGSLLLSSRSTLRLAAVAVRLVIPLLYSLKRFDAEGPLLLRPILPMPASWRNTVAFSQTCGRAKSREPPGIFF